MAVGLFEEVFHALSCNFFQHCSIPRENFIDFCQSFCGRVVKKAFHNFRPTFSQIVFWRKKILVPFSIYERSLFWSRPKNFARVENLAFYVSRGLFWREVLFFLKKDQYCCRFCTMGEICGLLINCGILVKFVRNAFHLTRETQFGIWATASHLLLKFLRLDCQNGSLCVQRSTFRKKNKFWN